MNLNTAVVQAKREKYSRKNNPAVILMEKVIAAKKASNLRQRDYYSVEKYDKLSFALSDITPKVFEEGTFKAMPFLKEHVETSPETGKLILPLSVDETVSQEIYRKKQDEKKSIIKGQRTTGMNELIDTGDILASMLQDVFTEVNIYEDDIRFVQSQFLSPIATNGAIAFIATSSKTPPTLMATSVSKCRLVLITLATSASRAPSTSWRTPPSASPKPTSASPSSRRSTT